MQRAARAHPPALPRAREDRAVTPLGGIAARDPVQYSMHRKDKIEEPLSEYRTRHARLDARLRLRVAAGRPGFGTQAAGRLSYAAMRESESLFLDIRGLRYHV